MAVPQIGGSITTRSIGNVATLNISAIPLGGWMVLSVMSATNSITVTPPGAWSVLKAGVNSGTRQNFLFGKLKDASDGTTVTITQSTTATVGYGLLWGTGADDVSSWGLGAAALRNASGEPSGARYKNTAPSLTTLVGDSLVVAISNEATSIKAQALEVASVAPAGWTQRLWLEQFGAGDRIETIWMGSKEMATAGASNDVVLSYVSPQDANGWAVQIALPPATSQSITTPHVVGTPAIQPIPLATSTFTVMRPIGTRNGDYIVVAVRSQDDTATTASSAAGFTRLGPAFVGASVEFRVIGLYGHGVTDVSNEPQTYTFNSALTANRVVVITFLLRNVDITDPVSGFFNNYGGTVIPNGRQIDSYPVSSLPGLSVIFAGSEFGATNSHIPTATPAGYTQIAAGDTADGNISVSRTYAWLGVKDTTSSPVTAASIVWGTPAGPAAEGITFKAGTPTQIDTTGAGFTLHNGEGDPVQTYYTSTDGPRTPTSIVPMRRGFNSVAEMLATPGFTWAHRGGSVSYPEHSLYAYTQAVARGYGVLEISLGRTSDGVWFGLHDQTTDRTSGGTYGNASSQTWAQIQSQQIVIGPGAPKPYMRWSELITAYGSTHIFVVDPKYALGSHRTEFLNMVYDDLGPTRAIIKCSGPGSSAVAFSTAAKALGFETWGYFYAADASATQGGSGALQTWGQHWTILGMEHGASQAIWDEVKAFNKPIVGHIAATQAAYNTAIAKGAIGVQVSGVSVVDPVSWWTA